MSTSISFCYIDTYVVVFSHSEYLDSPISMLCVCSVISNILAFRDSTSRWYDVVFSGRTVLNLFVWHTEVEQILNPRIQDLYHVFF